MKIISFNDRATAAMNPPPSVTVLPVAPSPFIRRRAPDVRRIARSRRIFSYLNGKECDLAERGGVCDYF
jgi:hypothetical protein